MPRTMPRSVMVSTGISGSGTVSSTAMIAASSIVASMTPAMAPILHPFERERDSLADTDAHRGQRQPPAIALQLLSGREREPRTRHAERMAERERAAVGVRVRCVVGKAQLTQHG